MVRSRATSVTEYLRALSADRREVIATVRQVVLENLPDGYEEAMTWGMITYQVPLSVHPRTYNGRPLMYAALASQKDYCVLHLMGVYGSQSQMQELRAAYAGAGKKIDMGKGCLRFKTLDDLPVDIVGRIIAALPVRDFVAMFERSRRVSSATRKKS